MTKKKAAPKKVTARVDKSVLDVVDDIIRVGAPAIIDGLRELARVDPARAADVYQQFITFRAPFLVDHPPPDNNGNNGSVNIIVPRGTGDG